MHLSNLPLEIIAKIGKFLPTRDILNLSETCKHIYSVLFVVKFDDVVDYEKISQLSYFDSFTCVIYNQAKFRFPKSIRHLLWYCNTPIFEEPLEIALLVKYTSLQYRSLPEFLSKLLYLTFGKNYDHKLRYLPESLVYLRFKGRYTHSLSKFPMTLKYIYIYLTIY